MALTLWNLPKPNYDYLLHESFRPLKVFQNTQEVGTRAIDPLIQTMGLDIRKEQGKSLGLTYRRFPHFPVVPLICRAIGVGLEPLQQFRPTRLGLSPIPTAIKIIQDDATLRCHQDNR